LGNIYIKICTNIYSNVYTNIYSDVKQALTKFAEPLLKRIVTDKMNGVLVAGLLEELNMAAGQVAEALTFTVTNANPNLNPYLYSNPYP